MDKQHWGDPNEFRPERFINDKGEYIEDPWLIPFGLGKEEYKYFIIKLKILTLMI